MKYWINTVSRNRVQTGVAGGFTQADHGKNTNLKKLNKGDFIVFYSPRTEFRGGQSLQSFTAIGRIADEDTYQVDMSSDFHPWRRRVDFLNSHESPIAPLIQELDFIRIKDKWGYPFRRGLFKVERPDFERIAKSMHVELELEPEENDGVKSYNQAVVPNDIYERMK